MIRAIVFDLDGVVVRSEKLKAQAYAITVQRLRGLTEPGPRAIESYRTIVGASREVASRHVMHELGLEQHLRPLMPQYSASEPSQLLTAMRKTIYKRLGSRPSNAPRQPVAAHGRPVAARQRKRLPHRAGYQLGTL